MNSNLHQFVAFGCCYKYSDYTYIVAFFADFGYNENVANIPICYRLR